MKYFFTRLKNNIRIFYVTVCDAIKVLIYWFPLILKDKPWDYAYLFEIEKHKLQQMLGYHKKYQRLVLNCVLNYLILLLMMKYILFNILMITMPIDLFNIMINCQIMRKKYICPVYVYWKHGIYITKLEHISLLIGGINNINYAKIY